MFSFAKPKPPRGYANIGNSCYMNSVLQCLRYCDAFIAELRAKNPSKGSFVDDFLQLVTTNDECKTAEIFRLLNRLKKRFKEYKEYQKMDSSQEDANEFLLFILGQLHKDLLDPTKQENNHLSELANKSKCTNLSIITSTSSIVGEYFIGSTKNMVKCLNCNKIENQDQYFFCISVPIIGSKNIYFDDCLDHFVKETTTDSENNVLCDKCWCFGSMTLQTTLDVYPEYLIIHLQRAVFYESIKQCSIEVICPVVLMIPKSKTEYVEYELNSFINYSGNARKGHYTSTCKINDKQWVYFDDSRSSHCASIKRNLSRAYLLFYKRQHYN